MSEFQLPRIEADSKTNSERYSHRGTDSERYQGGRDSERYEPHSPQFPQGRGLTDRSERQPMLPNYPRPDGPRRLGSSETSDSPVHRRQEQEPERTTVEDAFEPCLSDLSELPRSLGPRGARPPKSDRGSANASSMSSRVTADTNGNEDTFLNDISPKNQGHSDRSVDRFDYSFVFTSERPELHDAMEAATNLCLHMVYTGTGSHDPPRVLQGGSTRQPPAGQGARIYEIPDNSDAVLLLCYADYMDSACNTVTLLKKNYCSRPIISVIMRPAHGVFLAKLSSVATELKKVGVDHVIMQPRDKQDLAERIQSALGFIGVRWQIEGRLVEECDMRANSLFFDVVDQVIEGFPRLNSSMEEKKATRNSLGGVGRHEFSSVLGEGKFGRVYTTQASGRPDAACEAVKVIPKRSIRTARHCNQVLKECRLMQNVRHPNIAEFRGLVHAMLNMYIFMEFVGTADLSVVIRAGQNGRLESSTVLEFFLQICDAVAFCHQMCVAHRDIKSENVVVTSDVVPKLVDFGLAVPLKADNPPELCCDKCGTIPFAPPEVYRGKPFEASAMDVWGLGILTLEMRCGNNSVCKMLGCANATEPNDELADIVERFFSSSDWPLLVQKAYPGVGMAEELLVVMQNCLVVAPEYRWRAADLWGHIAESRGTDRQTGTSRARGSTTGREPEECRPTGPRVDCGVLMHKEPVDLDCATTVVHDEMLFMDTTRSSNTPWDSGRGSNLPSAPRRVAADSRRVAGDRRSLTGQRHGSQEPHDGQDGKHPPDRGFTPLAGGCFAPAKHDHPN